MKKGIIVKRPWCPFCGQKVEKATDATQRKMHEFPVGSCQCGAVYTCDATGHNVGSAMVEALVFACGDHWDFAWELMPEDDYLTGRIEQYDEETHQVVDLGNIDGRPVRGVLYFVRLHTEISEIARRFQEKNEDKAQEVAALQAVERVSQEEPLDPKRKRVKANKKKVKECVENSDVDALVTFCFDDKKTLRLMQRLLYDPYEEKRWHVAWVIGQVCARVASREPGQVSELIHRLFEACSDSAATPWGMIETIGGIIAGRPDIFGAFTQHLLGYLSEESTQQQVVWSMAEIAAVRPDLIRDTSFYHLFHFLGHPQPATRGLVARLLGRIKATEAVMQIMGLQGDQEQFTTWEQGKPVITTVAAEATAAVAAIHGGSDT